VADIAVQLGDALRSRYRLERELGCVLYEMLTSEPPSCLAPFRSNLGSCGETLPGSTPGVRTSTTKGLPIWEALFSWMLLLIVRL